jgi:hypothetical protein
MTKRKLAQPGPGTPGSGPVQLSGKQAAAVIAYFAHALSKPEKMRDVLDKDGDVLAEEGLSDQEIDGIVKYSKQIRVSIVDDVSNWATTSSSSPGTSVSLTGRQVLALNALFSRILLQPPDGNSSLADARKILGELGLSKDEIQAIQNYISQFKQDLKKLLQMYNDLW